jgi:hypothetical protein
MTMAGGAADAPEQLTPEHPALDRMLSHMQPEMQQRLIDYFNNRPTRDEQLAALNAHREAYGLSPLVMNANGKGFMPQTAIDRREKYGDRRPVRGERNGQEPAAEPDEFGDAFDQLGLEEAANAPADAAPSEDAAQLAEAQRIRRIRQRRLGGAAPGLAGS